MALTPIDEIHAAQIQAGTLGRKTGHTFEDKITEELNAIPLPLHISAAPLKHVTTGDPAKTLLEYVCSSERIERVEGLIALSTGALATSEEGRKWLEINGANVRRCKSDLVLTVTNSAGKSYTVGVSTKQCNNSSPTNAQLYFTTARGFSRLLIENGINVSDRAVDALRHFCGDGGFRPCDDPIKSRQRLSDPRRYFWEEIDVSGREEWVAIFTENQDKITELMLQKAYSDDPFVPTFLLHKTKRSASWEDTETAIYRMDELISHSRAYQNFTTKLYSVKKGQYPDPPGVFHEAPRFGIVQMQRGGQKQHPNQLQFNLEAGYFYKIEQFVPNMPS